jgi:hypothetical protein
VVEKRNTGDIRMPPPQCRFEFVAVRHSREGGRCGVWFRPNNVKCENQRGTASNTISPPGNRSARLVKRWRTCPGHRISGFARLHNFYLLEVPEPLTRLPTRPEAALRAEHKHETSLSQQGLNLYGGFGVKRFSLSSAQSSILFKFLCSVGEPFLRPGLHPVK